MNVLQKVVNEERIWYNTKKINEWGNEIGTEVYRDYIFADR